MTRRIASVDSVEADGQVLCTVRESDGREREILVFARGEDIVAWDNHCMHELDQRLDTGDGPLVREDAIVCPRHGSTFEIETGECEHGPAAGARLTPVDVEVHDGSVYLTDETAEVLRLGGLATRDDPPASSSHINP